MLNSSDLYNQITEITSFMVGKSLCDDQNFPRISGQPDGNCEVSFTGNCDLAIALRNIPYFEMYKTMNEQRAFNVKLIDGALIQMLYKFRKGVISSHRLAFFPSPYLSEYQNNPDLYDDDEFYADVLFRGVVSFPIRFDYSDDEKLFVAIDHPKSHLTLGQYKNCRIPVSAPLAPYQFMGFILRSFYNTAYKKNTIFFNARKSFDETIHADERKVCFLSV